MGTTIKITWQILKRSWQSLIATTFLRKEYSLRRYTLFGIDSQNKVLARSQFKKGMTIIEMTVYVGILGILAVFLTTSLLQILSSYQRVRAEREVISNARLLLESINKTIANAQEIYAPTSRFNTNAGQLSLITRIDPTPQHQTKYIDIWIDAGQLLMREEGKSAVTLSAASVSVSQFRVEHIFQGLNRQAIKLTLRVDSVNSKFNSSTTLNSTTALRGNY